MIYKDSLLNTINNMPNQFSVEEIIDRIILLEKIEQGNVDSEKGNVYSTEHAKEKLKKWLL